MIIKSLAGSPPGATNSYQVGVNHGGKGGTSYQKVKNQNYAGFTRMTLCAKNYTGFFQVTGFDDYGNKFEFENGVSHLAHNGGHPGTG